MLTHTYIIILTIVIIVSECVQVYYTFIVCKCTSSMYTVFCFLTVNGKSSNFWIDSVYVSITYRKAQVGRGMRDIQYVHGEEACRFGCMSAGGLRTYV